MAELTSPRAGSAAALLGTPGNGVAHLPYGSFRVGRDGREARLGVRLGDSVLPVAAVLGLAAVGPRTRAAVDGPNLDALLALSRREWDEVRAALQAILTAPEYAEPVTALATPVDRVVLELPFTVADYVDFYGSEHHATNVGRIFRPDQAPLTPNWKHLPIGYHGRAGTIAPSGVDVVRPHGLRPELGGGGAPTFGPSRRLDFEAEVGFVLGDPVPTGRVPLAHADRHIFGVTLLNDWSARDIQAFEYVPLGPHLGKSFHTTISPWVTPLAALDHARVAPPPRDTPLAPYLDDTGLEGAGAQPWGLDLAIEIAINGEVVSVAPYATTYWTAAQMLAHLTVNGASLRAGDLFASGTVSGPEPRQRGSLLELAWGGTRPLRLADGRERAFLLDGDEVTLRATAPGSELGRIEPGRIEPGRIELGRIELGECRARVLPARSDAPG